VEPYIASVKETAEAKLAAGKELAEPYIASVKETSAAKLEVGKEFAAPYIASVKETSAPYIAKLEEIRTSKRVEAMVAAFKDARERPTEKVSELRAKAVDLIKYESLKSYRDHVLSAEFQADTARLVKVELPAVAAAAAKRGAETIKMTATSLAEELEAYKAKAKTVLVQGYEMANEVELDTLRTKVKMTAAALLGELQDEVSQGVEHAKAEGFSITDVLARLKRIGAAVEKLVIAPMITKSADADADTDESTDETTDEATDENTETGAADEPDPEPEPAVAPPVKSMPASSPPSVSGSEDGAMYDAAEEVACACAPPALAESE